MTGKAFIRDEEGNVYSVDPKDPAAAKFDAVAPETVQQAQLQAEYGGAAGQLEAGGLGALDALTFGFGSGALGELGGDDWSEGIRGVQEANPKAGMLGTALGALAPALLTDGGSLAEEAPLLSRLGGGVLRGGLEGGLYGAGSQVSEDILGHTDTTAEKLIAGIGHGALLGGAAGGAFETLGSAVGSRLSNTRLRSQDLDAIAEKEFGTAAPGVGKALKMYAKASSAVSGADASTIETLASKENRGLRTLLADNGEKFQDETARAIRESGDALLASNKLVTAEARGELKASYVKDAVKRGNEADTKAWALNEIDKLIGGAQDTLDAGGGYTKAIEHASTAAYRAKALIEDATGTTANATMFTALDNMKRDLQKLTRNSYQTVVRMQDPIEQRAAKLTTEWLDKASSGFRDGLENESLWGKAAADQRAINSAWTKQIDASNRFHSSLTTDIGRDPTNPYLQMRGIDPSKASTYVRGITNPDKDLTHRAVKDYLSSTKDLSSAIEKSYQLPAESMAEVRKLNVAAEKFTTHIDQAEKAMTFINQFKALKGHSDGIGGHLSTAGAVLGGAPGAVLGGIASTLSNPAKQIERLAALERLQAKVSKRLGGIGEAVEGKASRASLPTSLEVTPSRASFEASAVNLQRIAANPEEHQSLVAGALGSVGDAAPKLTTAITMKSQQMTQFLASQLPPGMSPQDGTLNPKWAKPLYTDAQMNEWRRLAAALHSPVETLHSGISTGTLTPKEAAAIKQFFPGIYGEAVTNIQTTLASMDKAPPREKRLALSTVLDIPADLDLTSDVTSTLQSVYNTKVQTPPEQQSSGPHQASVSLASHTVTPAQRVEGGR
jgi:hypothetical protein